DYSPNVTAPVVQVTEPDNMDIGNFNVGQSTTYTVVLTNTGSVPVKDVSYTVPIISGNYRWKPTSENLGLTIEPQESATITVEITLLDSEEAANVAAGTPSQSSSSTKNGRCKISTVTDYYWECGPDKKWGWYPHEIKLIPPIDCPPISNRGFWTVYGHGLGSPGGGDGGSYSSHDNFNGVNFSAECDPCMVAVTRAVAECLLGYTSLGCTVGILSSLINYSTSDKFTSDDWVGVGITALGCYVEHKILGPIINTVGCAWSFTHLNCGGSSKPENAEDEEEDSSGLPTWVREYKGRIQPIDDYINHYLGYYKELFGSEVWLENANIEELNTLLEAVVNQGKNAQLNANALMSYKPQDISIADFNKFIERINNTRTFENVGNTSDNMIHSDVLRQLTNSMKAIDEKVADETKGKYLNIADLFVKETDLFVKRLQEQSSSTCATISLQIDQTMTMTRQAFRGTLTVTNGSKEQPMTDVKLKLNVTNTQTGLTATAKEFEMHTEKLQMFNGDLDMESGWYLGADSTGTATILFIPSKYAAPTEPVDYSFGGTLSYVDPYTGLEVTRELYPVTLTVKPSPELDLTYFMQRDIYGDDALTDAVEPMVPGEFAVILNNKGYGDATNVRMVTQQPKIIENEKGLYINFEFLSSQLNGQDKTLAMGESIPTEFGTIPAHSQAYAQWWLQSTLLGHFVEYNIEATHVTSYGNENLSLLDQVTIHELIHGFTPTDKGGRAFLVNDISDIDDLPDQVYFTDATQEDVSIAVNAVATKQSDTEYTLEIVPLKGGWNYGNVLDPTVGRQKLIKVVRQRDNKELPLDNVWQTDRTLIDGKDWHYENRLHFVGDMVAVGETYLLTFEPKPDVELEVERFDGVPAEGTLSLQRITEVTVTFNKAIDANSFTTSDLALACQGTPLDASKIAITKVDDRTFKLSFTALSTQNGYYVLTVQTAEITDAEGFRGATGKQATWIQFADGKVVLAINASPENGGKVTPASGQYEYEKPITLTATPNEGFGFVNWVSNGLTVVSDQPSLEYIPKQDATLTAVFQPKNVNVTVNFREDAGTIEGGGTGIYAYGTELTLKATPADGFQFDGWMIDSVKVAGSPDANTLTFNVTKPIQVDAIFSVRPDIILSGRVTSSADNTPIAGATITLTHDDMVYTTTTDRFGRYSLQIDDRSLTYAVHCEATGYIWSANDDIWFDETAKTKDFVLLRGESVVVPSDGIFAFSPNVDVKVEDLDVTVWYVTEFDNTSFVMKQVTSGTIKAGEGIIIVGTSQERLDMLAVKDAPEIPNNLLIGTGRIPYEVKDDNVFILNEGTDSRRFRAQATTDTHFYRAAKGTVIPEGKAYIHYTLSDLPDEVGIIWDDTSLIKIVKQAMEGEEKHFGLDGRRIYKIDKGLHILKGRKVIVK
ncbi:MAG: carboxypeptidase regulatory-like domain-containing protein, partial [Prevotella sp.]|nr:carboxypeptidase regulatory-like domain-containing protein [Prevotella sp.]